MISSRLRMLLSQAVVGADETWWRLMGKGEGKGESKRWQIWIASVPNAVVYPLHGSRAKRAAEELFDGYEGILLCDGYSVYSAFAKQYPKVKLAHCWAHVRRKFIEVEESFPEEATRILALIGELYEVERRCPRGPPGDALRAELRATRSRAILGRSRRGSGRRIPACCPRAGWRKRFVTWADCGPGSCCS